MSELSTPSIRSVVIMKTEIKKGDKLYSSSGAEIREYTVEAAGPKYITIEGKVRVIRETMLRDKNYGAQQRFYTSREELVEILAKDAAWNDLYKIVRDRYTAPSNLTSAQILAAVAALKGE